MIFINNFTYLFYIVKYTIITQILCHVMISNLRKLDRKKIQKEKEQKKVKNINNYKIFKNLLNLKKNFFFVLF